MTLLELLALLKKHLKLVVMLPVLCAVVMALVAWLVLPNTYSASVTLYVLTSNAQQEQYTNSLSNNDLTASQMLTNDVATLVKSDRVTRDAASSLGMDSLEGYKVSVDSQTTTRVITLTVSGRLPQSVASVANSLAAATDTVAQQSMGVESVNVIDQAYEPTSPSGPPRKLYTAVAALAGFFAAVAIVVVMDMLDTRVRNAEDAEETLGIPVIGRIPVIRN